MWKIISWNIVINNKMMINEILTSNLYRNFGVYVLDKSGVDTCVPQFGHNVSDNEIFNEKLIQMLLYMRMQSLIS